MSDITHRFMRSLASIENMSTVNTLKYYYEQAVNTYGKPLRIFDDGGEYLFVYDKVIVALIWAEDGWTLENRIFGVEL